MERIIAYLDGFNLYYGLRDSGFKRYYWLNLKSLVGSLLTPTQQLMSTKYFTARISAPPDKRKRQTTFIEALETLTDFAIFDGKYQSKPITCKSCGATYLKEEEKMTDVNIAIEMLTDAYEDNYDTAFLLSADSDLSPPILAVQRLFPKKRIVLVFPPGRSSAELKRIAGPPIHIDKSILKQSQFPDHVQKRDGFVLRRPQSWR